MDFLRYPHKKIGDSYSIKLKLSSYVKDIIEGVEGIFLDESEALILFENNDFKDFNTNEIVITNGSKGSRVISDKEYKIEAVKNEKGNRFNRLRRHLYGSIHFKKLTTKSILKSANFASKVASDKLCFSGPFKGNI